MEHNFLHQAMVYLAATVLFVPIARRFGLGSVLGYLMPVKKHFLHLHIVVRSSNRYDAYDLMNAGMMHIYRESIDTSIRLGVDAMTLLGYRTYTAKRLAKTFFKA